MTEPVSFHMLTTQAGEHWIVKRDPENERFFERVAVFPDEEKAKNYLRIMHAEYELDRAVEAVLPELIQKFPRGIKVDFLASYFGVRPAQITYVAGRLHYEGRARYLQPMDRGYRVLAPRGYELPTPELTEKQRQVYELLIEHSDSDGIVRGLSRKQMGKVLKTGDGNVTQRLETLERKGFIQKVHPGDSMTQSIFQILK
mgnify:CR=1 FL=1